MKTNVVRVFTAVLLAATLAGCGFQLRGSSGQYNMPFQSIYLAFPETSPLGTELKRNLRAGDAVRIENDASKAQALFDVLGETRGKSILSLNSLGRVREYALSYTLVFRVRDANNRELLGPTEITLRRNIAFDESQVLAKESEEALLYRDMQSDLVQQILRRLAAIKPAA
ncbi:LPS assembly lipoprotein LptE [Massilia sp. G4R7]|uniref:LPS-assembly lipoprotein LptE n=1 Tax=Massilia phyllostachyos TaxID=2898585 RepID=A0ABS8PZ99_9BURK|nr:LPS assembly lipoprotein LptE [Massilia phyllostachyos]MCD2514823.1 LPS assembly lipoprotein LptE [Massilia phyllostachyos]